jgi:uncharacterized protein DUF262
MKVSTILDHIDSGHMALPEFQRGYVWNRDQVRGLLDSLYKGHPADSTAGLITEPTLTWGLSEGAFEYLVEIATDAGFTSIIHSPTLGKVGTYDIPQGVLTKSTEYFWRVSAINGTASVLSNPTSHSFFTAKKSDLNNDGIVNGADLGILLGLWGPCPAIGVCVGDLGGTGDGFLDGSDLGVLLGEWGS